MKLSWETEYAVYSMYKQGADTLIVDFKTKSFIGINGKIKFDKNQLEELLSRWEEIPEEKKEALK